MATTDVINGKEKVGNKRLSRPGDNSTLEVRAVVRAMVEAFQANGGTGAGLTRRGASLSVIGRMRGAESRGPG